MRGGLCNSVCAPTDSVDLESDFAGLKLTGEGVLPERDISGEPELEEEEESEEVVLDLDLLLFKSAATSPNPLLDPDPCLLPLREPLGE